MSQGRFERLLHTASAFARACMYVGILLMLSVASVGLAAIYGPALETKHLPVLIDMDFTQVARDQDQVEFVVSGRKVRQCTFKSVAALSVIDGSYERSVVNFNTPTGVGSTAGRPLGQQRFGHWFTKPTGTHIKFISVHDCHPLWDTVSDLGEVDLF